MSFLTNLLTSGSTPSGVLNNATQTNINTTNAAAGDLSPNSYIGSGVNDLGTAFGTSQNAGKTSQQALTDLTPSKNFYNTILGGNSNAIQGLLQPQISTTLGQYDAAAKQTQSMGPRGGGTASTLAQLPFSKVGVYQNALNAVRPNAAAGSESVAAQEGNIGSQQNQQAATQGEIGSQSAQVGQNLLNQETNLTGVLLGGQNNQQRNALAAGTGLGQGIGSLVASIIQKIKFPNANTTNPTSTGTSSPPIYNPVPVTGPTGSIPYPGPPIYDPDNPFPSEGGGDGIGF